MLKDKIAVVTGGTRGIGLAIVKKFLENKCTVILFGSRKESVNKAINELKEIDSEYNVYGFYPNLNDITELKSTFDSIVSEYGTIDILVNNAGISARESIYDYKEEDFEKIMNLNVNAVFRCIKLVAPIMKKQGGGVILNTSSMVSLYGQSSGCGYPASKFAVNGLTKSLSRELGKDNIRVNAVAPGVVNTDMVKELPDEVIKPLIATIPLGRMAEPEDIANAFLFLASDLASYVTGEILSVDGATRS
jgi:3-oxoacyl-[acyl-carrier protein] reductase/7-alpha-hydroxysteroid dehydrogenase